MEVPRLGRSCSVLVVDPLDATGEVLRWALAPQGVQVLSTRRAAEGLAWARRHQPDLVVYDCEDQVNPDDSAGNDLVAESQACERPVIVLGRWRHGPADVPRERVLAKPYHYAALVRRIEQVLAARR